jgi:hypothetical protein
MLKLVLKYQSINLQEKNPKYMSPNNIGHKTLRKKYFNSTVKLIATIEGGSEKRSHKTGSR